jgi:alpha-tubulin suppressor-like RCC1 family protein
VQTPELYPVVNAGLEHVCGVTTDAHAYCWGRDLENQLGDGTEAHRSDSVPTPVAGSRLYKQIDAGVEHSCALSSSDAAFCWGLGPGLGDGKGGSAPAPVRVVGGLKFTQLSTGWDRTCAVTFDRRAYCWGAFITGQVDGGGPMSSVVPVAVMTDYSFTRISTGEHLTCGITPNSRAVCWGVGWTQDGRPHQIHALM